MYKTVRVQNFRCFEDLELSDLARVNLIGGANNVGKSSLLEAIAFHSGGTSLGQIFRVAQSINEIAVFPLQNIFYNFSIVEPIYLTNHQEQVQIRYLDSKKIQEILLEVNSNHQYRVIGSNSSNRVAIYEEMIELIYKDGIAYYLGKLENEILQHRIGKIIYETNLLTGRSLLQGKIKVYADWFSNLDNNQYDLLLASLFFLEPRLTALEIRTVNGTPILHGKLKGLSRLIPINAMGEGIHRLCNTILAVSSVKDGVLLIDEIENGLYYETLPDVWRAIHKAAVEFNVQIFATTHSYEMINAAQKAFAEYPDEFRYHRLDRSLKTGQVKITTYEPEILVGSLHDQWEVR